MAQASERKRQALLRKETEWIMRGCRARSTKSTERIARYEALKAQEAPPADSTVSIASAASRLGRKTVELSHISKAYGSHSIIRDFSYTLLRDDRVGIIGRNGAGKSTLLNMIAGTLTPDSGSVDFGGTVRIGYFTQEGRELNPAQRPWDYLHEIASEVHTKGRPAFRYADDGTLPLPAGSAVFHNRQAFRRRKAAAVPAWNIDERAEYS